MTLERDRRVERAQTFDKIAELYDASRREPPAWLYETLFAETGLDPAAARVVEIGCGTGKSTLPLAQRGASVLALEMGANMARIARRNLQAYPRVQVVTTRFEEWQPEELFDLALAVTSWHWMEPATRCQRAAAALKPGGVLAFTVGGHVYPEGFDPFFAEIQQAYEAVGSNRMPWPPPAPEAMGDARDELERSQCYRQIRIVRRIWAEEFTADRYVAMMETASDHQLMEPQRRAWLFSEMRRLIAKRPSGRIVMHSQTMLHLAWK